MDINILNEKIINENWEEACMIIEELGRQKNKEVVPILINHLVNTENHGLRDTIAIALSDISDSRAVKPILSLLTEPKTENNRGTLLYSLEGFDVSEYAEFLVELVFDDNFEVSRQSLNLIEGIKESIPLEIKKKCLFKIKEQIDYHNDKVDFLSESFDIVNNLKTQETDR